MTPLQTTPWHASNPVQFTDRRTQLRRAERDGGRRGASGGLVTIRVRAYRAVIARRVDGRWEQDRCPHAHSKPASARKCADDTARRRNRGAS